MSTGAADVASLCQNSATAPIVSFKRVAIHLNSSKTDILVLFTYDYSIYYNFELGFILYFPF